MKWYALVPSYEPEIILKYVVTDLVKAGFQVVVVDDGSGQEYAPIFNELKEMATVLSYEKNRGKGYALKTGLNFIKEELEPSEPAVVVTVDGDGQHLISDAVRICQAAEENKADLVIGSRILSADAPAKSRFGNGLTRFVFKKVTRVNVYDTQSGLRAFRSGLIPVMVEIPGQRYEYEMNVLLTLARMKANMLELPIKTIYFDKKNSVSHFHAVKDSILIYGEILRFMTSSLVSFLIDYSLYSLFLMLLGADLVLAANIGARIISACVNFGINRRLVFKSDGKLAQEALSYTGLALFILCVNSALLVLLTGAGVNAWFAKLLVECILFFVSYGIQSCLIFVKEAAPC